jgi:hypothetical protein
MTPLSLALVPCWRDPPLVLVRATDGIQLAREGGYTVLGAGEACAHFDSLDKRDLAPLRAFLAASQSANVPVALLKDHEIVRQLRDGIRTGVWVAVRKDGLARGEAQGSSSAKQSRIVRAVEQKARGRLDYQGGHYRLVADVDVAKLPRRDELAVVGHDEATRVLAALAAQPNVDPDLAALLGEARGLLARDWRLPSSPDGLVLLRQLIVQVGTRDSETPAMTPSQLEKLRNPVELDGDDTAEPEDLLMLVDVEDEPDFETEVELAPPDDSAGTEPEGTEGEAAASH